MYTVYIYTHTAFIVIPYFASHRTLTITVKVASNTFYSVPY